MTSYINQLEFEADLKTHLSLSKEFFCRPAYQVAPDLIDCILIRETSEGCVAARVSETEAYTEDDAASHSHRGKTARNSAMFGDPGSAYVYFTYGMHYCFNVVTGAPGIGEAVLIRAAEPLLGMELMAARRGLPYKVSSRIGPDRVKPGIAHMLCGGPAKLCQAFAIGPESNFIDLDRSNALWICRNPVACSDPLVATQRIGITKDRDLQRRYVRANDGYTSRRIVLAKS